DWSSDVCSSDLFPNSTLQKHGTGRSGGPGRDRCDENQPGFIWVAVGIRNPGDCCFDSGPCFAESRLRLETIHRVAATSVTRPTRHFLRRNGKARPCRFFSRRDRKSTRLNSSHGSISYAVFCLKKKIKTTTMYIDR